jgi:hypothetical protein
VALRNELACKTEDKSNEDDCTSQLSSEAGRSRASEAEGQHRTFDGFLGRRVKLDPRSRDSRGQRAPANGRPRGVEARTRGLLRLHGQVDCVCEARHQQTQPMRSSSKKIASDRRVARASQARSLTVREDGFGSPGGGGCTAVDGLGARIVHGARRHRVCRQTESRCRFMVLAKSTLFTDDGLIEERARHLAHRKRLGRCTKASRTDAAATNSVNSREGGASRSQVELTARCDGCEAARSRRDEAKAREALAFVQPQVVRVKIVQSGVLQTIQSNVSNRTAQAEHSRWQQHG